MANEFPEATGRWIKQFPSVDGDYYSRLDEYDRQPTPIRIENGAVYEFGCANNLRHEYEVEDYEYLGPITPTALNSYDALREAAVAAAIPYEALLMDNESRKWIALAPEVWSAIEKAVEQLRAALHPQPEEGK